MRSSSIPRDTQKLGISAERHALVRDDERLKAVLLFCGPAPQLDFVFLRSQDDAGRVFTRADGNFGTSGVVPRVNVAEGQH